MFDRSLSAKILTLAALVPFSLLAPTVSAGEETLETPAGVFYVMDSEGIETCDDLFNPNGCAVSWEARAEVWTESNGKDGLQRYPTCGEHPATGSLCPDGSTPRPEDTRTWCVTASTPRGTC